MLRRLVVLALMCCALPCVAEERFTGPWNVKNLLEVPEAKFGEPTGLVREVYYAGEPYKGKPTRIFAYYGRPEGTGPFPAMLLVHGGGGHAFKDWALHWAKRGYVALAMDLAGHGPEFKERLPDGGPDQDDVSKFGPFTAEAPGDMWTYHAVAAVLRGHSLLAAQPDVDRDRIGVTGISWGGYLTCIIAGIDDRLKVAVPVYGCGFLHDNSAWKVGYFDKMDEPRRKLWVDTFDPSRYLPGVRCPILFLNGTNDFAYPMDSYQKCYNLVPGVKSIAMVPRLPHGHIWTFKEVDAFVDNVLMKGPPLAKLSDLEVGDDRATTSVDETTKVAKAELHYTTTTGAWQQREWKSLPATVDGTTISATLPKDRPIVFYLSVTDDKGLFVSTNHAEK